MLVGFISFFRRGSASQLLVGVLWTLAFMVAVTHRSPFKKDFADSLKTSVDCAILVTLVLSIVIKLDLRHEAIGSSAVARASLIHPPCARITHAQGSSGVVATMPFI